jgi:catechol 2,3-dioxygenase-like lactoylglutathione lyase family enzyme
MKIKSVSGFTCYVKNLNKTAKFYETLGFEIRKRETNHITAYSNWYWIDFIAINKEDRANYRKEADAPDKGAGVLIYLSVDDVDAFHKDLLSAGLKPASAPGDTPFGNREFMLRDPDGYRLVIFKRK